jgi:hypothetical protein
VIASSPYVLENKGSEESIPLVHKMRHVYTGKTDARLAIALGSDFDRNASSMSSDAVQQFLASDCTRDTFKP